MEVNSCDGCNRIICVIKKVYLTDLECPLENTFFVSFELKTNCVYSLTESLFRLFDEQCKYILLLNTYHRCNMVTTIV